MVEHLFEQRGQYLSTRLQRREAFLQHIPTANLATHMADRIEMERKGLQVYQLQQEVRRALVVSHVDVGVSLASTCFVPKAHPCELPQIFSCFEVGAPPTAGWGRWHVAVKEG